jgi:glycosyltransferase involved in cell wall biosynthesis
MLRDKGITEFVAATRTLRDKGVAARFLLVGDTDTNPTSISKEVLDEWSQAGLVEWLGYREDIPELLRHADVAVLPSYREGLPKFLIEAAATALPIVATDVPGCREIVVNGLNGYLVPVRQVGPLANALEKLLLDPDLRMTMGRRGRELVERSFRVERVVDRTMKIYGDLLTDSAGSAGLGGH